MTTRPTTVFVSLIDFVPGGGRCTKCDNHSYGIHQPENRLDFVRTIPGRLENTETLDLTVGSRVPARGRLLCTCRDCGFQWLVRTADDPENGAAR